MKLSASRTETYYQCPFQYFCKYGLYAYPRKEAELNNTEIGTFVHEILEKLLENNEKAKFVVMSEDELRDEINKLVDEYIETKLSGADDKPADFGRKIELVKENMVKIALQLVNEFVQCEFEPVAFELAIESKDNDETKEKGKIVIPAYKLLLDDGGSIALEGKVDRVDAYYNKENNKKYIRIIDYKTYSKEFKLYETLEGLNTQMLIYLFAIEENGKAEFGDVEPAGILYFPAQNKRITNSSVPRNAESEKIKAEVAKNFKMSGMVLKDLNVIEAMEKNKNGVFIPVKKTKEGFGKGSKLISKPDLQKLKTHIDDLLKNMATELHCGNIVAMPTEDGCQYCDYKSVCGHEEKDPIREIVELDFDDVIKVLGGGTSGRKED
jgi:ATP-dependent helicase/nuclease subunit B